MSLNEPLLVATTNPGKIREIRAVLDPLPFRALDDLAPIVEPEETGRTFADNALLKARYYARASGLTTIAEDSGLAIDALGGRPGVESARYPGATYDDKFANLFRELEPHPRPWTARFVCSVAIVAPPDGAGRPDGRILFTCEATVEGEITTEPRGTNGFGYDPIFVFPAYGGTLAAQTNERKLAVAHRGRAFRRVREYLERVGVR
ncbi:MAG TPA: RdgB/HAM1 family non-canonical purine NTP pyrophosphatase [Vicinamibacterales bacterium]|nr:RdgB/HAM1 family non-canonical purine NTP pyrophosphatase [Vicinamibacterales bacterium]